MKLTEELKKRVRDYYSSMSEEELEWRFKVFEAEYDAKIESEQRELEAEQQEWGIDGIVKKLKDHGLDVLYTTYMIGEETFCLKTEADSVAAWKHITEDLDSNVGYYYSEEEFWKSVREHVERFGYISEITKVGAIGIKPCR